MAVTKLWKVENNLKKVLDYTKNPDKTRKLNYSLEDIQSLKNVLAYAKDEERTEQEFYVSGINCNSSKACEQFVDVKTQYGKTDGIQAYHGYMSFKDTDNVTPELAHQIGMNFARRVWGDRFQIVVTTHLNTKCLHCHFVINSVSFADGKMMHGKEKAWFYFRHIADEICKEYNLYVIENPDRNRPPNFIVMQDRNNEGQPTRYNLIRNAIDEAIANSGSMAEFKHNLSQMGYSYKISPNLKYWTVIPKGYKQSVRLYRLGDNYTNIRIQERIAENGLYIRLRPFQKNISYSVPKEIDLRCKKGSLYNRYLYYCYKLGYLPKKEKPKYNNAKLHYLLREDLMKGNTYSPTVIVVPITSKPKKHYLPTHVCIGRQFGLPEDSMLLAEHIRTVDRKRLLGFIGIANAEFMLKVDKALEISLGLYKGTEIKSFELSLCGTCLGNFFSTKDYEIRRIDPFQSVKETCTYCQQRTGYDYSIKTRKSHN